MSECWVMGLLEWPLHCTSLNRHISSSLDSTVSLQRMEEGARHLSTHFGMWPDFFHFGLSCVRADLGVQGEARGSAICSSPPAAPQEVSVGSL